MRIASLGLLLFVGSLSAGEHWPGWRGPTGMGVSDEKDLPLTWGGKAQENVRWKAPLFPPGKVRRDQNQSSPIVWGDRVFVTVSHWPEGASDKDYPEHHLLCFQANDGQKLWDAKIPPGPWKLTDLRGGYTAPTPACDANHVYALFGSAVLAAVDRQGQIVWRQEITPHHFDVALGSSPVLFGDTVLITCDQMKKSSRLLAFATKTGELKWKKDRDTDWAHSTPTLTTFQGKPQLLLATANGPQGVDPATGELLWWYKTGKRSGDTVSPVTRDGLVYVDSGRGGGPGVCVPIGTGEAKTDQWTIPVVPEGFSSPVLFGEHLYRLHSPGVLACWRFRDGKEVFKERLPGVDQAVSPVVSADGRIYCASAGKTYVVQAGNELKILAQNDLGDPSKASPAMANGRLYLKGGQFLYCLGSK